LPGGAALDLHCVGYRVTYLLYVLPLFMSVLVALGLGAHARRFGDVPGARPFAWAMVFSALWLLVAGLEIVVPDFTLKALCHRTRTVFVEGVGFFALLLAIEFTGHCDWLTRRRVGGLLIVPLIIVIGVATSEWHSLFRTNLRIASGPIPSIVSDFGPLFYLHAVYTQALIVAAIVLLAHHLGRALPHERAQVRLLLAGLFIPIAVDGLEFAGAAAIPDVTLTPLSWAFSGILCAWALFGFGLFDVEAARRATQLQTMVANLQREIHVREAAEEALRRSEERHRLLFETMAQGAVYRDANGRVIDANPAALSLMGVTLAQLRGEDPSDAGWHMVDEIGRPLPESALPSLRALAAATPVNAVVGVFDPRQQVYRWLNVSAVPRFRGDERAPYQVYTTFEDITERRQAERLLAQRVADQSEKLAAVYEVMRVADPSQALETAFENALDRILQATDGHAACLHILDNEGLRLFVQTGLNELQRAHVERLPGDWLADQDGIYLAGGPHSAPLPDFVGGIDAMHGTYVGAPIRVGSQRAGVLGLLWQDARSFSVEDIALLRAIAEQVGIILENIRLRERIATAAALSERRRLARDLHDSVTQSLHSLVLTADNARALMQRGRGDQVEPLMDQLSDAARQALKEMRLLLYELRLRAIDGLDLADQLALRLDAVERRAGIDAQLVIEAGARPPQLWSSELYPIIMEALNNALKHAHASHVRVVLSGDATRLEVEVTDDGDGFDTTLAPTGGMGLKSMAERAERLGGVLSIQSALGQGTRVHLLVPRREEDHR
jgi:PAS domain S-box-containing protein